MATAREYVATGVLPVFVSETAARSEQTATVYLNERKPQFRVWPTYQLGFGDIGLTFQAGL